MMKDGVVLINAARGGIINEQALLNALQKGRVSGAAVDVWSEEPPKTELLKELISQQKLVVTPHLGANTYEAQINVAVDVSKEILNYLDEQPLENAVNIPRFDLALMEQMRPFLNLIKVMGDFAVQLIDNNPAKVTFSYTGALAHYDCSPLTVCGLATILDRILDQNVNMVNAPLIAESMGIVVEEHKSTTADFFSNLITLTVESHGKKRLLSGTLFEGAPRIVRLRDYAMDFSPEGHMLLLSYADRPGIIGRIGTILGNHDINIAAMNLGRREKKGEAMVILSLDSGVPSEFVEEVQNATEATFIKSLNMTGAVQIHA
jgi:D-3-phosphoglycerate dehydrogenase